MMWSRISAGRRGFDIMVHSVDRFWKRGARSLVWAVRNPQFRPTSPAPETLQTSPTLLQLTPTARKGCIYGSVDQMEGSSCSVAGPVRPPLCLCGRLALLNRFTSFRIQRRLGVRDNPHSLTVPNLRSLFPSVIVDYGMLHMSNETPRIGRNQVQNRELNRPLIGLV